MSNTKWQIDRQNDPKMAYYKSVYTTPRLLTGRIKNISEKRLMIYFEQGVGDSIQMLRYVPYLLDAKELTLHCRTSLHRLIQNQWNVNVLEKLDRNVPHHDFHIMSMDLPFIVGEIPASSYINIDKTIPEILTYAKRIGIAWEGNPDHPWNDIRSCPLQHFKTIDGHLFCLQDKIYSEKFWDENIKLLGYPINDFYDTACLINSMDYIVTVDTSILHLAGAMGKKTFGLLAHKCDPRWGTKSPNTNWYPSVKFLRQKEDMKWEDILIPTDD